MGGGVALEMAGRGMVCVLRGGRGGEGERREEGNVWAVWHTGSARAFVRVCTLVCVRVSVRASVHACVGALVRACVRVRAGACVRVRASVRACACRPTAARMQPTAHSNASPAYLNCPLPVSPSGALTVALPRCDCSARRRPRTRRDLCLFSAAY